MKPFKDIKGKGKANAEPAKKELFNNMEIRHYQHGYLTIRDADTKSFVSYAHGIETMRSDEWGFIHGIDAPESSTSASQLQESIQSIAEASKTIALKAGIPVGKGKGKELAVDHNPYQVFGQKPTKLDRAMENSKTLTNLVSSLKKLNVFKKEQPPHRTWDRRGEREKYRHLSKLQMEEIMLWDEGQIAHYNECNLAALSSKKLKELQEKNPGQVIYANPVYKVPNPTPTDGEPDEEELEMRKGGERAVWGCQDDPDPLAEHQYLNKDLRMMRGPYKGFHIIPGTNGITPEIFGKHNNLSDYYGMPLIEIGRNRKWEELGFVNLAEAEFLRAMAEKTDGADYGYANRYAHEDGSRSPSDSDDGWVPNVLNRPRAQLPGQALMIYLNYSGLGNEMMPRLCGRLNEKFLYEHESRWWNGYRIPQHTQLTYTIAEKVLAIAKAPKQWWEEERDRTGYIPEHMEEVQSRIRARAVARFAVQVVENYFWWRLLGETLHKEVRSGPMMRIGEY